MDGDSVKKNVVASKKINLNCTLHIECMHNHMYIKEKLKLWRNRFQLFVKSWEMAVYNNDYKAFPIKGFARSIYRWTQNTTEIEGKDFTENMNDEAIEREYIGRCPFHCVLSSLWIPSKLSQHPRRKKEANAFISIYWSRLDYIFSGLVSSWTSLLPLPPKKNSEPVLLNGYGAPELIPFPRNEFRQPM